MNKIQQITELKQAIINDQACSQLASGAKQLVMGEGSLDAEIVFIGEAPGKKEDETGQPFVGAAGKFLNLMLESAGLERKDVYITNIVKYRPPNNRDPTNAEKQAFWPYLARQLEVINPKAVVTLGRHSMEFFLPEAKIGQIHGQPVRQKVKYNDDKEHSLLIVPLYHPAAALYNGSLRQVLIDDFTSITRLIWLIAGGFSFSAFALRECQIILRQLIERL